MSYQRMTGREFQVPLNHRDIIWKGRLSNGNYYCIQFDENPIWTRADLQSIYPEAVPFLTALGIPMEPHPRRERAEKGHMTSRYTRTILHYIDSWRNMPISPQLLEFYERYGEVPYGRKEFSLRDLKVPINNHETIWKGKKKNGVEYKLYVVENPPSNWDPGTIYPEVAFILAALGIPLVPHKRKSMAALGYKMSPYVMSSDYGFCSPLDPRLEEFYNEVRNNQENQDLMPYLLKKISRSAEVGLPEHFILPVGASDSLEDEEEADFESLWSGVSGQNE